MAGNKVYLGSAYSSIADTNEEAFMSYVDSNPGSLESEIVSGSGLNATLVSELIVLMREKSLIMVGYDVSGNAYYWTPGDFATLIWNNRAAARTWVNNNSGSDVQAMATSLGVHEAIANALANGLRAEGLAKLVVA